MHPKSSTSRLCLPILVDHQQRRGSGWIDVDWELGRASFLGIPARVLCRFCSALSAEFSLGGLLGEEEEPEEVGVE